MKKLLLILLCLPMIGFGQGWEQTYGTFDEAYGSSAQQTSDGGYIACGSIEYVSGERNLYLVKTDSNGVEQWNKTYVGIGVAEGKFVQQTSDGGYIICGLTDSIGSGNVGNSYIIKTDAQGDSLWTNFHGYGVVNYWDDESFSVQQTSDGGYIVCGFLNIITPPWGGNMVNAYLLKLNSNGADEWIQTYGNATHWTEGYSVQQTADGGYVFSGVSWDVSGNNPVNVFLVKTDTNGVEQWSQTYGGTENDYGYSVQQTTDGGYIICGRTFSFGNGVGSSGTNISGDVYLIKVDSIGTSQWTQTFGGVDNEWGRSAQQTTDGGYIITGWTYSFGQGLYLIKTDSVGIEQWNQIVDDSYASSVQQTSDGGYIVCGTKSDISGSSLYLLKTNSMGNMLQYGCTDLIACNYDTLATIDDGSCTYPVIWYQTPLICDGDSIAVGNNIYDTAGVYMDTLNTSNGCDSVVHTYLMIDENTSSYDTLSVGASILWNGSTLSVSGDYSATLINSVGCDSIVNLNLTVTATGISDLVNSKSNLVKITDVLGQETPYRRNTPLFYIYDDGTVEKRIVLE